jgi:hypothetical protein
LDTASPKRLGLRVNCRAVISTCAKKIGKLDLQKLNTAERETLVLALVNLRDATKQKLSMMTWLGVVKSTRKKSKILVFFDGITVVDQPVKSQFPHAGIFSKLEVFSALFWQKITSLTHLSSLFGLGFINFQGEKIAPNSLSGYVCCERCNVRGLMWICFGVMAQGSREGYSGDIIPISPWFYEPAAAQSGICSEGWLRLAEDQC